jgi:hypothetical protein
MKLFSHYVIRGESATIQNLALDKDEYFKGDTAIARMYWTGSVDEFAVRESQDNEISKPVLRLLIADYQGSVCADRVLHQLDQESQGGLEEVEFEIWSETCIDPYVSAQIVNEEDVVVTRQTYTFANDEEEDIAEDEVEATENVDDGVSNIMLPITVILGMVLLFALLGWGALKFSSGKIHVAIFMVIIGMFTYAEHASADVFVVSGYTSDRDRVRVAYSVSLDQSTYEPGERMYARGKFMALTCSNGVFGTSGNYSQLDVRVNGDEEVLVPRGTRSGRTKTERFSAPSSSGRHYAHFTGYYYGRYRYNYTYRMSYQVEAPEPRVSFSVSPSRIEEGDTVRITWSSRDATACLGTGDVSWSTGGRTSGSETVRLDRDGRYTFRIACTGPGGD